MGLAAAPNLQAVFKCMLGSYPLWTSTYLGILVGCHQIEDGTKSTAVNHAIWSARLHRTAHSFLPCIAASFLALLRALI